MAAALCLWPWLLATALSMAAVQLALALRALRYWQRRHVPCAPFPLPFVGHFAAAALGVGGASEPATVNALYAQLQGEPFAGVYLGHSPALLLREPALVKAVLSDHFDVFPTRTAHASAAPPATPLADNVFNAEGERWRDLRQRLTPNFTPGRTRRALPALLAHAQALVRALRPHAQSGRPVALKGPLLAYAVDGVSEALLGLQARALADPAAPLLQLAQRVEADSSAIHQFAQLATPRLLKVLRGADAAHQRLAQRFAALARDVLAARAASPGAARGRDFVQLLARSDHAADSADEAERRVAAHVCCMLYAGAHKPSALLSCALAELAAQPELQEQLRAEVAPLAAGDGAGAALQVDALEKAPLLDAVLLETLRLHPAEPVLTRVSRRAWALPGGGGAVLEAGTRVLLPVAALQRDAALFPRPDAFRPQRFLPGAPADHAPFLPFGLGPRKCVGYRLGLLQAKVALAALLASYRFAPAAAAAPDRARAGAGVPQGASLRLSHVRSKSYHAPCVKCNIR